MFIRMVCAVLCLIMVMLTHWGRDKFAAISQKTFSKAFSLMKMYEFQLRFHSILSPRVIQQYSSIGSNNGIGADEASKYYLNQRWLVYWHIYVPFGLNELRLFLLISFRITSLTQGQSYDCPSASEETVKEMGKYIPWINWGNLSYITWK